MRSLTSVVERPSAFDSFANYAGQTDFAGWDCLLTRNRDSDVLTECNFAVALERLGGEGDDVQVYRFGHWACGWWEALAVRQGTAAHARATEIAERLADYPVLDDDAYSAAEQEAADQIWRDCYSPKERIAYIRRHRSQFEPNDWRDLRACVRGEYFGGYASELVY